MLLVGRTAQFGISGKGSLEVAGHVDFGDYLDETLTGVGNNLANVVLRVESAIVLAVRLGSLPGKDATVTPSPHLGQAGIFLNLNAPSLVLGQVPVETVELIGAHDVKDVFHRLLAEEMASLVKHEATPSETRFVCDGNGWHRPAVRRLVGPLAGHHIAGHQLLHSLERIEETGRTGGSDAYTVLTDVEAVCLRSQFGVEGEHHGSASFFCQAQFNTGGLPQVGRKTLTDFTDTVARIVWTDHLLFVLPHKLTGPGFHACRQRNQREFRSPGSLQAADAQQQGQTENKNLSHCLFYYCFIYIH